MIHHHVLHGTKTKKDMRPNSHQNPSASILLALLASCLLTSASPDSAKTPAPLGCASPIPLPDRDDPNLPPADFIVTANGNFQYLVNGTANATLTLTRGQSYTFDLTAFGDEHPFVITANPNNPFGNVYMGPSSATTITFTPNAFMPATIHYYCVVHYGSMRGTINLVGAMAPCPGDLNSDQVVNSTDFGLFVGAFGTNCSGCKADMNSDGLVNSTDFGLFVGAFGSSCG